MPSVELDAEYLGSGWKTTELGRCAALVDTGGKHGFVIAGAAGSEGDASMRVVAWLNTRELFIEIRDDTITTSTGAPRPNDDHVEVWLGKQLPRYELCSPPFKKPVQWGIRLADARVFASAGSPDPRAIRVEKAAAVGGAVRLRIGLPDGYAAVTVAYSDSGDGRKPKRRIATSMLVTGDPRTLGEVYPISEKRAVCRKIDGRLEPEEKPTDPASIADP